MRIATATIHRIQIPLKRAFAHALSDRSGTDAVLVRLTDENGGVGWGEILPRPYVTGESIESVLSDSGPRLADALRDVTFEDQAGVVAHLTAMLDDCDGALATMSGFELATLDLAGRRFGFSAASCLGEHRGEPLPPGVIIGFEHETRKLARYCAVLRLSGKRHVKVKVGLPDDVQRCQAVTKVFGPDVPLRIDANAAWSVDEAVATLQKLAEVCPLHSVEQPVAKEDFEGLAEVRRASGVPVMADESVCSLDDARRLIEAQAADIFNVRPGKHGGLLASHRLCALATASGVRLHLGTLVGETGILSRASEVFSRCQPGLDCLDGKGQNAWLLAQDVLADPTDAAKAALDAHGLGIEVQQATVESLSVAPAAVLLP